MISSIRSESLPIRGQGRVLSNVVDRNGRKLRLAVPDWPGSIPGQFVMVGTGATASVPRHDPLLPRPMAVYRDLGATPECRDSERAFELLYRVVGRGTTLLSEAQPGESVSIVGPLGEGFPVEESDAPALLVGGGTGIASLYELARALAATGRSTRVLLGARAEADLIGFDDFAALASEGVELICATEDGSVGVEGRITLPLEAALTESGPGALVVCEEPPAPSFFWSESCRAEKCEREGAARAAGHAAGRGERAGERGGRPPPLLAVRARAAAARRARG